MLRSKQAEPVEEAQLLAKLRQHLIPVKGFELKMEIKVQSSFTRLSQFK